MENKAMSAFVKALMQVQAVEKTKLNEQFKSPKKPQGSSYADLSSVIEAANAALHPNGLAFSQDLTADEFGVSVRTNILHESGEALQGEWCKFPAAQKTPQGYGSTSTYVRRYSLKARLGMADEDDDGNAGSTSNRPPAPEGMAALAAKKAHAKKNGAPNAGHDRSFVMPFANKKNEQLHQLTDKNLAWFQNALETSIGDPSKSKYVDSNKNLLSLIDAEMAFRGAQANGADEPPPLDDKDLPF